MANEVRVAVCWLAANSDRLKGISAILLSFEPALAPREYTITLPLRSASSLFLASSLMWQLPTTASVDAGHCASPCSQYAAAERLLPSPDLASFLADEPVENSIIIAVPSIAGSSGPTRNGRIANRTRSWFLLLRRLLERELGDAPPCSVAGSNGMIFLPPSAPSVTSHCGRICTRAIMVPPAELLDSDDDDEPPNDTGTICSPLAYLARSSTALPSTVPLPSLLLVYLSESAKFFSESCCVAWSRLNVQLSEKLDDGSVALSFAKVATPVLPSFSLLLPIFVISVTTRTLLVSVE